MSFLEAVEIYFRGERHTGLALVPFGLAMLACGVYLFRFYGGGFGKTMGALLACAGVAAAIGGPFLARTVNARQAKLSEAYVTDQEAPRLQEQKRIEKVNASWMLLKSIWTALMVASLASLWLLKRDWIQGVALTLVILATVALVVDVFAERRALTYAENIKSQ